MNELSMISQEKKRLDEADRKACESWQLFMAGREAQCNNSSTAFWQIAELEQRLKDYKKAQAWTKTKHLSLPNSFSQGWTDARPPASILGVNKSTSYDLNHPDHFYCIALFCTQSF